MLSKIRKTLELAIHFKEESTAIKIIHNILQINNLGPSDQYDAVIQPLTQAIRNSIDYSKYLTLTEENKDLFRALVAKKLNEMAGNALFKSSIFQMMLSFQKVFFKAALLYFPRFLKIEAL